MNYFLTQYRRIKAFLSTWFKIIIYFSLTVLICWIGLSFYDTSTINNQIQTEKETDNTIMSILVNGDLKRPLIKNRTFSVEAGDIVVINDQGDKILKRFVLNDNLPTGIKEVFSLQEIPMNEVLSFNIPGRPGKYWLGETMPTAFEVETAGQIEFSLSYPNALTDFVSAKFNQNGVPEFSPIEISLTYQNGLPAKHSKPRQIVRLKGIAGTLLPELQIENKKPGLDLKKLADESIQQIIAEKPF